MAELPAYFFQRTAQRQPTAAGDVALPAQPRLDPHLTAATARTFGQVGEVLGGVGQQVAQLDQQLRAARDTVVQAEALGKAFALLETTEAELLTDPQVRPEERGTIFGARITPQIQELAQGLSPRARGRFLLEVQPQVASRQRTLRVDGRKAFVEQATAGLTEVLTQLGRQELTVTDPVALAAIRQSRAAMVESYVQQGLIDAAAGAAVLRSAQDAVQSAQLDRAVRAYPDQMARHLEALARGEPGLPDMPEVPADKIPALLDEARQQWDASLRRSEHQEVLATRVLAQRQDVAASEIRTQLYKPGITTQELGGLFAEVNARRASGELSEGDHSEMVSHIQSLTDTYRREAEARAKEARARRDDAPRRDAAILIETAETPAEFARASAYVLAISGALTGETLSTLLGRIQTRRDATNYTNRDSYREGKSVIMGAAFPIGVEISLDRLDQATKVKLNTALDIYSQTMGQIHEQDGFRGVDVQAREQARRLRDLYFPRDEDVGTDPLRALPARPPELEGLAYGEALLRLEALGLQPALKQQIFERLKLEEAQRQAAAQQKQQSQQPQGAGPHGWRQYLPGFLR
jgi:hypothetical protein